MIGDSLIQKLEAFGVGVVEDVRWVTDSLVHSIEQPISMIYADAKTVAMDAWSITQITVKLGTYWLGAWLLYTFVGSAFPKEKRMLENTVSSAWKRMRLM